MNPIHSTHMEVTNMVLSSVSSATTAKVDAAPEMYKGYPVKEGKIQGSFYQYSSTIAAVQADYDKEHPKNGEAPVWKRPFIFLKDAVNSLLALLVSCFKFCLPCFFKAEEAKTTGDAALKADKPAAAAGNK